MSILMGGPGSSGSSMLRFALDRHPEVFSGAELTFFNKDVLFDDWEGNKALLKGAPRRLSTSGWSAYPGTLLLHPDYKWSEQELHALIDECHTFKNFYTRYFERVISETNARVWIEKTPSNCYCFSRFLALGEDNRVVHVVRNPYDTMASLMKRGMSPFFAAGVWVYNNAAAMTSAGSSRYMRVRYEDLVAAPEVVFDSLYRFIGVDPALACAESETKSHAKGISSWGASPSGEITSGRVGSFKKLPLEQQRMIRYAFSVFKIRPSVVAALGLPFDNGREACEQLGYEYLGCEGAFPLQIIGDAFVDWAKRTRFGYRTGLFNYPAFIDWQGCK